MTKFTVCVFDTEATFTDKLVHSMSVMAIQYSLKQGKFESKKIAEMEMYNSDYFGNILLANKENVTEKIQKAIRRTPGGCSLDFFPFSVMMSAFAYFVVRYGGTAISHSADRDLEFIMNSDRVFGSLLFDGGDVSSSSKIPKWSDINFVCSQYLICNSKWAHPYNNAWPHSDNKLATLSRDFKKQDHTALGDTENLRFVLDRLCNVSNGQFLDFRVNAVFAKPPAGIR